MLPVHHLKDMAQWEQIWAQQEATSTARVLIFKRSPICPTSHEAEAQFKSFASNLSDEETLTLFSVDVIGQRPIAQRIAADTGIQHQSPQAILIGPEREILWQDSHWNITTDTLTKAIAVR